MWVTELLLVRFGTQTGVWNWLDAPLKAPEFSRLCLARANSGEVSAKLTCWSACQFDVVACWGNKVVDSDMKIAR